MDFGLSLMALKAEESIPARNRRSRGWHQYLMMDVLLGRRLAERFGLKVAGAVSDRLRRRPRSRRTVDRRGRGVVLPQVLVAAAGRVVSQILPGNPRYGDRVYRDLNGGPPS